MNEDEKLAEYYVVAARVDTRALIAATNPVLHDLRQQLDAAKRLLDRLDGVEGLTQ